MTFSLVMDVAISKVFTCVYKLMFVDVTWKYQGHIVGIYKLQVSCAMHVSTGGMPELISCKIHLCKKRLIGLLLAVHCR